MVDTISSVGMEPGLFSVAAAMAASAKVALVDMVSVFIMGTLPISRLKTKVEFSTLATASRNFRISGLISSLGRSYRYWAGGGPQS
jgi:hypothetical protein